MSLPDRLDAAKICAALGDTFIGREIIVREQTSSTNDDVWQLAKGGALEGLVVFAEHQTAGRGQRGNVWESAAHKGLWLSILLRPKHELKNREQLAGWVASVIVATLRREFHLLAEIKLPNDVYAGGRKIAGVLVELRAQENAPHLAIIGIGINVNQQSRDFSEELRARATSIAILRHAKIERHSLAVALLRTFDLLYAKTSFFESTADLSQRAIFS